MRYGVRNRQLRNAQKAVDIRKITNNHQSALFVLLRGEYRANVPVVVCFLRGMHRVDLSFAIVLFLWHQKKAAKTIDGNERVFSPDGTAGAGMKDRYARRRRLSESLSEGGKM